MVRHDVQQRRIVDDVESMRYTSKSTEQGTFLEAIYTVKLNMPIVC